MQSGGVNAFVVFFQTAEDGIDIGFIKIFAFINSQFFSKLFVIACAKSTDRITVDAAELAPWIVIVEYIGCWIFFVVAFAVAATYDVYTIVITIK